MNTNIEIDIVPYDIALKVIIENIKNFFINDVDEAFISPFIETDLAKLIDELKEDVFFVIEYPYVDKVYRDSYYNYYASKHYSYQRDCIRVSLFSNSIKYEDFLKSENHQDLNEST